MEINRIDTAAMASQPRAAQKTEEQDLKALATDEKVAVKPATEQAPTAAPKAENTQHSAGQAAAQQASAATSAAVSSLSSGEEDDDSEYQSIVAKANSGQQLTPAELNVLRSRNPALYGKATQAQSARTSLRTAMEDEPAKAYQTAQSAMAAVAKAAGEGDETLATVHKALSDEYQSFAAKYDHVELSGRQMQPLWMEEE